MGPGASLPWIKARPLPVLLTGQVRAGEEEVLLEERPRLARVGDLLAEVVDPGEVGVGIVVLKGVPRNCDVREKRPGAAVHCKKKKMNPTDHFLNFRAQFLKYAESVTDES